METRRQETEAKGHRAGPKSSLVTELGRAWGWTDSHWAECTCGWYSQTFPTWEQARAAADEHLRESMAE